MSTRHETVGSFCLQVVAVSAVLLFAGCEATTYYPLNPNPEYYYVNFALGAQGITCNYGVPPEGPPWLALSPAGTRIHIESMTGGLGLGVTWCGWLIGLTPGIYVGAYDGTVGLTFMYMIIHENGVMYHYSGTGAVTIDAFGAVGGDIEGSFSLTFAAQDAPSPTFGTPLTAIGGFRLLRVADSYYQPW